MAEKILQPLVTPNLRITLGLGSMGIYGEMPDDLIAAMPQAATAGRYLQPGESFGIAPENHTTRFLLDWQVFSTNARLSIVKAVCDTEAIRTACGIEGVVLEAGRACTLDALDARNPNEVWDGMRDMSGIVEETLRSLQDASLPDDISADYFR